MGHASLCSRTKSDDAVTNGAGDADVAASLADDECDEGSGGMGDVASEMATASRMAAVRSARCLCGGDNGGGCCIDRNDDDDDDDDEC